MTKPFDFGGAGVNGSIDRYGRIIALNFYHSEYGYVTLTSADPFPDSERYNQAAVRAYRKSLTELEGFGFTFDAPLKESYSRTLRTGVIETILTFEDGQQATINTRVSPYEHVTQWCEFSGNAPKFSGRVSLQRCAYTQLTEGGILPAPPTTLHISFYSTTVSINNESIGLVRVLGLGNQIRDSGYTSDAAFGLDCELHINGNTAMLRYLYNNNPSEESDHVNIVDRFFWMHRLEFDEPDPLLRRAIIYSENMAVPTDNGFCILTDHMLLPLSWNRDAYYVARLFLSNDGTYGVEQHIKWMFDAERINGAWGRCYLANGKIKDKAFQLDQQLFPLLEYAEYMLETEHPDKRLEQDIPQIHAVIDMLLARKAAHAALFPTDETPADDPIAMPYHLSSHILFWVVLNKLARIGIDFVVLRNEIRTAIDTHFIAERDGVRMYAYATDGHGNHHFYHDANDFPTVLAPIWGFCAADDPVWRATIDFAFSPVNSEAHFGGRLGSVHTRAAWSLGDVQDLIVARILGDKEREERAIHYLRKAAAPDGSLPEAYDPETGETVSRHWFAWTNAAYACVQLGAFKP
jgi:uncharacterized protein